MLKVIVIILHHPDTAYIIQICCYILLPVFLCKSFTQFHNHLIYRTEFTDTSSSHIWNAISKTF